MLGHLKDAEEAHSRRHEQGRGSGHAAPPFVRLRHALEREAGKERLNPIGIHLSKEALFSKL